MPPDLPDKPCTGASTTIHTRQPSMPLRGAGDIFSPWRQRDMARHAVQTVRHQRPRCPIQETPAVALPDGSHWPTPLRQGTIRALRATTLITYHDVPARLGDDSGRGMKGDNRSRTLTLTAAQGSAGRESMIIGANGRPGVPSIVPIWPTALSGHLDAATGSSRTRTYGSGGPVKIISGPHER